MYDEMCLFGEDLCLCAEYITKVGTQEFAVLIWISGIK